MVHLMRDKPLGIESSQGLIALCDHIKRNLRRLGPMAELGSFAGESMEVFARYFPVVHCVDPWSDTGWGSLPVGLSIEEAERSFDERMRLVKAGIVKHKARADEIVEGFADNSLDLVYVDTGDHHYELTLSDIAAWWPKVRRMGFIGGHDYWEGCPDVMKAVRVFFRPQDNDFMIFPDTSWLVRKR